MENNFTYARRVEFRDTDMAGIVHFSVYFVYMEEAEHAFLRSLNLAVVAGQHENCVSWPRVAANCNYRSAIRYNDQTEIRVAVERLGITSVTFLHTIYNAGQLVADGTVTAVCCRIVAGQKPVPITIPNEFAEKLKPFIAATNRS